MGSFYKHILLAVDLREDNQTVNTKAVDFAKRYDARLTLLHVVEYMPMDFGNELVIPQYQDIEQHLTERAQQQIKNMAQAIDHSKVHGVVESGATRSVIIDYAQQHDVDLIVLGRHSRSGLSSLLGSTANSVLHHAPCDIFVVKV